MTPTSRKLSLPLPAIVIWGLLLPAGVARAQCPLTIDDFTTGARLVTLTSGQDVNVQTGSMVGGFRATNFLVGPPATANPLDQPGTLDIRRQPLIVNMGVKANWALTILYGHDFESFRPLNLNLTGCDRFRLVINGADLGPLAIVTVFTGEDFALANSTVFVPRSETSASFDVDLLFSDFVGKVDFSNVKAIALDLRSGGPIASDDFAVDSIAARLGPP